jgi:hypothetical protein
MLNLDLSCLRHSSDQAGTFLHIQGEMAQFVVCEPTVAPGNPHKGCWELMFFKNLI